MFSPGGGIIGDAGGAGIIHLHVCDVGDAMAGTLPGSPTKPDGTPREGDEFGITIYTRSGRVIVHPMELAGYPVPPTRSRTWDSPTRRTSTQMRARRATGSLAVRRTTRTAGTQAEISSRRRCTTAWCINV